MTLQPQRAVTAPATIDVRGIAKRYGRHQVFHDVSMTVPKGSLVGIEGENGAGKSTLLKCLVGLLEPDSGEIRLNGRMGYCPQEPLLTGSLTADEHFRLFGTGTVWTPPRSPSAPAASWRPSGAPSTRTPGWTGCPAAAGRRST
ncbi:MAG: ATP-binding cassette domain-containing protein [Streptosporangiales bacterium]|nr:ATP-binding cassette domain-containing protein [Streptosporangiales bacterium]